MPKNWEKYCQAEEILDLLPVSAGTLLDVGCGEGQLVKLAKQRGFVAIGIDPLVNVSLEKYQTRKKFNVITLKHVLEHIEKPESFLKKIHRLLTPGGYLIVSCPNMNSLMARIFLDRWYGLRPLQHRWQFTPQTLTKVFKESNFKIEKVIITNLWYRVPGWKGVIFKILAKKHD